jgi:hypothetical protein
MPWEQRGKHRYFYQTRRRNGRQQRYYLGRGPEAELAAAAIELRRAQREADRAAARAREERWQEAELALAEMSIISDLLVRAALYAAGYHQHARGDWRRRSQ